MASGYQLRSLTAVAEHLDRKERNLAHDRPSADETNYEEELTDTESEKDAGDPAFEPSSAAGCWTERQKLFVNGVIRQFVRCTGPPCVLIAPPWNKPTCLYDYLLIF
ncbi:uncharacterized protein LOC117181387 [Belonocnema kinseyi]|uniref:uncharacterized protein LOC117181387 n=1 Tax=Belonocnema kinseyi TaxID=2817044 RepID=UPI00143E0D63|nr:uncharacterized protein LOC117181387 [Belonocnema kinseyi]